MTENGSGLTLGWSGTPQIIPQRLTTLGKVNQDKMTKDKIAQGGFTQD